jgi:cytochrome b561
MWFHWTIALLVVVNLLLGLYHDDFERSVRAWIMFFHKSIGISVLALSIARLLWRLGHRPPPFDAVLHRYEALLARSVHWLFYVLMIGIPLTGWMLLSSSDRATDFFGLFEIAPLPVSRSDAVHEQLEEAHELLGKLMIGLIVLHVLGAVKHHLQGHRHLIGRMAPWLHRV